MSKAPRVGRGALIRVFAVCFCVTLCVDQEQSVRKVSERECAELNSVNIFRESKRVTEVSNGGEESLAEVLNIANDLEGCCKGKKNTEA